MERVSHCNVCFKTFNEGENEPNGTIEPGPDTFEVNLICADCRKKESNRQKAQASQELAMEIEEQKSELATARSSKTSKSQQGIRVIKQSARVGQRPRPQTSAALARKSTSQARKSVLVKKQASLEGTLLSGQKSQRVLKSSLSRPASRTANSSSKQNNFRVLKDYVKKGLVDILDRDGGNRRGCSARSDDQLEANSKFRVGQRPSDMQSFQQTLTDIESINARSSQQNLRIPQGPQMQAIQQTQQMARPTTQRVKLRSSFDQNGRRRLVLGKSASQANPGVAARQAAAVKDNEAEMDETAQFMMSSHDKLYQYLKQGQSGNIWRNAYYLSTSIEEDKQRHMNQDQPFMPIISTNVDFSQTQIQQQRLSQNASMKAIPTLQGASGGAKMMHNRQASEIVPAISFDSKETKAVTKAEVDYQRNGVVVSGGGMPTAIKRQEARHPAFQADQNLMAANHQAGNNEIYSSREQPGNYEAQVVSYLDYAVGDRALTQRNSSQQIAIGDIGESHRVVDHVNHGTGMLEGFGAGSLIKQGMNILNPCPRHPLNEISYLDKTTKEGACEVCLPGMLRANHELLPIKQTVQEVVQVLQTLDDQVSELQTRKRFQKESCIDLIQMIESDRIAFEQDQTNRINALKNYLDDRLRTAICDYRKATEPDLYKVKASTLQVEDHLQEIKTLAARVQSAKSRFMGPGQQVKDINDASQHSLSSGINYSRIRGLVEAVQDAGKLLRDFDDAVARLASDAQNKVHEAVYPNHLRDVAPVFKINPQKELEIIANKYRLHAQQMTEVAKAKLSQMNGKSRSLSFKRTQSANSMATRSERKRQQILGDSGMINQQLVPYGGPGTSERNANVDFFNRLPGANLQSTLRQKIKVVRWLSSMIAEYDVTNDFWSATEAKTSMPFRPFSTTVYLPNQDLVVLGGLDDRVPNRPSFQAQVILIQEQPLNSYENKYQEKRLSDMIDRRGCMTALLHEGYIYVIGGLNYTEKCLKKSERIRIVMSENTVSVKGQQKEQDEQALERWKKIADLREPRKNASAISMTADTIYIFGGSSNSTQTLSSIEQYSVASNKWQFLRIQMPRPLCFLTTFKISPTQLLILGGCLREHPPTTKRALGVQHQANAAHSKSYLSNQVYIFDLIEPSFRRLTNLQRGFISLYPPFYDGQDNALLLVNEDSMDNEPETIRYRLDEAGINSPEDRTQI